MPSEVASESGFRLVGKVTATFTVAALVVIAFAWAVCRITAHACGRAACVNALQPEWFALRGVFVPACRS